LGFIDRIVPLANNKKYMAELSFTDQNFEAEVLKSKEPVMVDFYAEWCGPCRMMGPVVEEIAKEFEGKWKVGKCNVDESSEYSGKFNIQSIPTIVFFKDGIEVDRTMGFHSKEDLIAKMNAL